MSHFSEWAFESGNAYAVALLLPSPAWLLANIRTVGVAIGVRDFHDVDCKRIARPSGVYCALHCIRLLQSDCADAVSSR